MKNALARAARGAATVALALVAGALSSRARPAYALDEESDEPIAVVAKLAALGPRLPSTPAHDHARDFLADGLRRAGAEDVRVVVARNGASNVEAVLRGAEAGLGEIVLAAHYDTVAESPGAADDAAGCAAVLGAVEELLRAPLRRTLRVVLFDGEEAGLLGSEAWVEGLAPADRDRILAGLVLDTVAVDREGAPVLLDLGGSTDGQGPPRTPAWLVHAGLVAGAAVGFPFRVDDHLTPLRAQLLTRTARVPWSSDAVAMLEAGIPSMVLTDFSALHPYDAMHTADDVLERVDGERLAQWVLATAAMVRRLDALEGRPRWEEEYLAFAGRVWIRRDLIWIGLLLWIAMVLRGRPGRWAGARGAERRARGRSYLPGYVFRVSFLLAAFLAPALAAPILYPLAPLAMITPRSTAARIGLAGLGCLPAALWLGLLAVAGWLGLSWGFALAPGEVAILVATLAGFGWQLWTRSTPRPPPAGGPFADGRSEAA
jgi:hypothetical protein